VNDAFWTWKMFASPACGIVNCSELRLIPLTGSAWISSEPVAWKLTA
jgi:hypothetical protein